MSQLSPIVGSPSIGTIAELALRQKSSYLRVKGISATNSALIFVLSKSIFSVLCRSISIAGIASTIFVVDLSKCQPQSATVSYNEPQSSSVIISDHWALNERHTSPNGDACLAFYWWRDALHNNWEHSLKLTFTVDNRDLRPTAAQLVCESRVGHRHTNIELTRGVTYRLYVFI